MDDGSKTRILNSIRKNPARTPHAIAKGLAHKPMANGDKILSAHVIEIADANGIEIGKGAAVGGKPLPSGGNRMAAFDERFNKAYKIPKQVRETLAEWLSRDDVQWAEDGEFQKACGISNPSDWKNYARENAEFDDLRLKIPGGGIIWCRDKPLRDELQMRAMS